MRFYSSSLLYLFDKIRMDIKNAEAETLKKKKSSISRAKVKKTIKNTLCRPDPVFWPNVTDEQCKLLEGALAKHKIEIPEFKKPHWKELKSIPKDQRPKQPKIQKVEGLIFGIVQSSEAVKSKQCSAIIIESSVNPRAIVQPIIEACISNQVHIVCLNGLKNITSLNFGVPTSCLAIKVGFLKELCDHIENITKSHELPQPLKERNCEERETIELAEMKIDVEENDNKILKTPTLFTYLYRTNKNTRAFNPSQEEPKTKKAFIGQDFIEFSDKPEEKSIDRKAYMTMIVKRLTNDQNRLKRK